MARHNSVHCSGDRQPGRGRETSTTEQMPGKNAVGTLGSRAGMSIGMAHHHKVAGCSNMEFWQVVEFDSKNLDRQKIPRKVVSSSWLGLFPEERLTRATSSLKWLENSAG